MTAGGGLLEGKRKGCLSAALALGDVDGGFVVEVEAR
jgi:hypothetical protein